MLHNTIVMYDVWVHQVHHHSHLVEKVAGLLLRLVPLDGLHCHGHLVTPSSSNQCGLVHFTKLTCNVLYDRDVAPYL